MPELNSWISIDEAPRDGTMILARGISEGDMGYTEDKECLYLIACYQGHWQVGQATPRYFRAFKPTHFILIPPW